jgi:hypothetical protein
MTTYLMQEGDTEKMMALLGAMAALALSLSFSCSSWPRLAPVSIDGRSTKTNRSICRASPDALTIFVRACGSAIRSTGQDDLLFLVAIGVQRQTEGNLAQVLPRPSKS